jgi:hypothetical protein
MLKTKIPKKPKRIHFYDNLYVREEDRRPYIPKTPLCLKCQTPTSFRTALSGWSDTKKYWGCTRKGCDGKLPIGANVKKPKNKRTAH